MMFDKATIIYLNPISISSFEDIWTPQPLYCFYSDVLDLKVAIMIYLTAVFFMKVINDTQIDTIQKL